jgi:hypothetical protein
MAILDRDGQPFNYRFNRARRAERDISQLLGLIEGFLVDGKVSGQEARHLKEWVACHPDVVDSWPGSILQERLERIFRDGRASRSERKDLADLLQKLVGGEVGLLVGEQAATELPLDDPPPEVLLIGSVFVFTGKFAFGPRQACEREVTRHGAVCERGVTLRTDYLVIGTFGSRDWVQTPFGRKIEKAVEYRRRGSGLQLISEDHWATTLPE